MFFLFREQQLGASNSVDVRYGARRLKSVGRCSSRSPPRSSSPYWHWRLLDWLLRHLVRSSTAAAPASTGGGTGTSSALTRRHSTCDALGCMDAARDLRQRRPLACPRPLTAFLLSPAALRCSGIWCLMPLTPAVAIGAYSAAQRLRLRPPAAFAVFLALVVF